MVFVIPVRHTSQSFSIRFVDIDISSIFDLVFLSTAAGFSASIYWCFARHCCWHGNFQLPTSVFDDVPEFFVCRFNDKRYHVIVLLSSFGFSIANFCFALLFAASDICFHTSGHSLSGLACFFVSPFRCPFV